MIRPNSSDAHRRIAVDIHADVDIDDITVLDRLIGSGECSRGVLGYGMPYISIAAVYESLALATTVLKLCR